MQQSWKNLLYKEGQVITMSILMADSGYAEYIGHEEVPKEDLEKAERAMAKYANNLHGKPRRKHSKFITIYIDAEE